MNGRFWVVASIMVPVLGLLQVLPAWPLGGGGDTGCRTTGSFMLQGNGSGGCSNTSLQDDGTNVKTTETGQFGLLRVLGAQALINIVGTNGAYQWGIDTTDSPQFEDFFFGTCTLPNCSSTTDVYKIGYTSGYMEMGAPDTGPNSITYRLELRSDPNNLATGNLQLRMAPSQTGNTLAITSSGNVTQWWIDAGNGSSQPAMSPTIMRDTLTPSSAVLQFVQNNLQTPYSWYYSGNDLKLNVNSVTAHPIFDFTTANAITVDTNGQTFYNAGGSITPVGNTLTNVTSLYTTHSFGGSQVYCTNCRKSGEGVGSGTGIPIWYDGTNWRTFYDDSVAAQ